MNSPPSLDTDNQDTAKIRFSTPLPPNHTPRTENPTRPTSLPLSNNNSRTHPKYQSRSASFYYDSNKLNKDEPRSSGSGLQASLEDQTLPTSPTTTPKLFGPQGKAYFIPLVSILQGITLFISYIVSWVITGSPIQTNPFNWFIGPSGSINILMGASFTPCMRTTSYFRPNNASSLFPCTIPTAAPVPGNPGYFWCNFNDLCGPLAVHPNVPDQSHRLALAIFLHAGILHYILNMLAQWLTLKAIEQVWGSVRIALVYMLSGVYGFYLSSTFGPENSPSVGASGAIFGCIGCFLIDLVVYWHHIHRPALQLLKFVLVMAVSFAIGIVPIFDNFAHIGGFLMGTLVAVAIMPWLNRERKALRDPRGNSPSRLVPVFFTFLLRCSALVLVILLFIFTARAFYDPALAEQQCPWCKYLSCVPAFSECPR